MFELIARWAAGIANYPRRAVFNRSRGTRIHSRTASLKALYGVGVSVAKGTFVSEDVSIGDYSYVNARSSLENCSIGKYCSISSNVFISPFEHPLDLFTTHPVGFPTTGTRGPRVIIGNDVLVSLNVVVTEGVTIADGAVIGANAVVTHDVSPYEIVGGVPAKHIGYRMPSEEVQALLKLRWWDWPRSMVEGRTKFLSRSIGDLAGTTFLTVEGDA